MPKPKRGVALLVLGGLLLLTATTLYAAVELSYFDGQWDEDDSPTLFWGTESEGDNAGFYVWRSTENLQVANGQLNTGQATKISPFITNPDGSCNPFNSQNYTYIDTAAGSGTHFYYFLESYNCGAGTVFYGANGNATGSGVELTSADAPPPATLTRTRTPSPTATTGANPTATATATGDETEATATPPASPTPPVGATATTGSTLPTATLTQGIASATATRAVVASLTPSTRATTAVVVNTPVAPPVTQEQPILQQPTSAPVVDTTLPIQPTLPAQSGSIGGGQGEQATPTDQPLPASAPTATLALALNSDNPAPGGTSGEGGAMSVQPQAATPTLVSLLAAAPATPVEGETLFATETSDDPLDRIIQGVIGLMLLGVVALIGFMGWTYVRR